MFTVQYSADSFSLCGTFPEVRVWPMRAAWLLCLRLGCDTSATAQSAGLEDRTEEFGFWFADAPTSRPWIGHARRHKLYTGGFRYARVFGPAGPVALAYTGDVIPIAAFDSPESGWAYGGGAHPGGLRLNFRRRRRVQPFLSAAGGFLAANRRVPLDRANATRVNFSFEFSGGFQFLNAAGTRAMTFGFKQPHVSNAQRTVFNPGSDYLVVYAGHSFLRRR
jgi:hypothetical protein